MTARDQLNPADPVPGLRLEPLARPAPLVVELEARIGAPYGWKSASRTAQEWAAWLAEAPDRRFWLLSFDERVWLHTSSQDHPNALPNYHRRGFRTFKTV